MSDADVRDIIAFMKTRPDDGTPGYHTAAAKSK